MSGRGRASLALLGALMGSVLGSALGCTGIGIRQFERESYLTPEARPEASRVFEASTARVWSAFVAEVEARDGSFDLRVDALGRGVATLAWSSREEAALSVDLGAVHRVVTETTRTYRSWSPLDANCNACVVRNGDITSQDTRVLEESDLYLDPTAYRIELRISARVEDARSGARLLLRPDFEVEPREPEALVPTSTGHFESILLDAVAARLSSAPGELR